MHVHPEYTDLASPVYPTSSLSRCLLLHGNVGCLIDELCFLAKALRTTLFMIASQCITSSVAQWFLSDVIIMLLFFLKTALTAPACYEAHCSVMYMHASMLFPDHGIITSL